MPAFNKLSQRFSQVLHLLRRHWAKPDPDGPIESYRWLWTSLGNRSRGRSVPRPIHFLYLVLLDFVSVTAWYLHHQVVRATRASLSTGGTVSILRRVSAGFAWAVLLPMSFAFLIDGILIYGIEPRGVVFPPWFENVLSPIMGGLLSLVILLLAIQAFRGRLPGTGAAAVTTPAILGGGDPQLPGDS